MICRCLAAAGEVLDDVCVGPSATGFGGGCAALLGGEREGKDHTIELFVSQVGGEFGGIAWDDVGSRAGQACRAGGEERQIIADQQYFFHLGPHLRSSADTEAWAGKRDTPIRIEGLEWEYCVVAHKGVE
jgi:hypothetical protein